MPDSPLDPHELRDVREMLAHFRYERERGTYFRQRLKTWQVVTAILCGITLALLDVIGTIWTLIHG